MNPIKALYWPGFLLFYLKEVCISNVQVFIDVITPQDRSRPAVIAMDLPALSDAQLLLFTSMISMTPGTLSMDVATDRSQLFIHVMYLDDKATFIEHLKATHLKWAQRVV